jgi:hypothetical protein
VVGKKPLAFTAKTIANKVIKRLGKIKKMGLVTS